MQIIKMKLTSRKFIMAVVGAIFGAYSMIHGDPMAGATVMTSSIIGYLVAEGYVDGQAVKNAVDEVNCDDF